MEEYLLLCDQTVLGCSWSYLNLYMDCWCLKTNVCCLICVMVCMKKIDIILYLIYYPDLFSSNNIDVPLPPSVNCISLSCGTIVYSLGFNEALSI